MKMRSFVLLAGMLTAFAFSAFGSGCKTTATSVTGTGGSGTCDPTACPDVDCGSFKAHGCVGDHCGTKDELCIGQGGAGVGGSGTGGSGGACAMHCAEAITDPCPMICDPTEMQYVDLATCASGMCQTECAMAMCGDTTCAMCLASKCATELTACSNDI